MDCIVRSSIGSASKIFPFSLGSIILFYCAYPAILCVNQGGRISAIERELYQHSFLVQPCSGFMSVYRAMYPFIRSQGESPKRGFYEGKWKNFVRLQDCRDFIPTYFL